MNGRQTEHNEVFLQLLRCEGRTDVKHLNGLNTYDYGARQYDGAKIVWDRMDQLCEEKPWNNPYVFCGANPINRIDPDGNDYFVCVANKSITIKATYYVSDEKSKQAAQKGCDFWNDLSGTFRADGRDVNFDLDVVICVDDGIKNPAERSANLDDKGNTFSIVNESDEKLRKNVNGKTIAGRVILVRESRSNTETPAHEIGHSLGLLHSSSGLMQPDSSTRTNNNVNKKSIKKMINNAITGNNMKGAGIGHVQGNELQKIRKIEDIKK